MAGNLFGRGGGAESQVPEIPWIPADENPWGVPVLDVRPLTQTMMSLSKKTECAENAISFGGEDGTCFVRVAPEVNRLTPTSLRYRRDRLVADGVLFAPECMEHKWAIFHHGGELIFVRSWTRDVIVTATLAQSGDSAEITEIRGAFCVDHPESPDMTVRMLDFLIRSHVLDIVWPVPLVAGKEGNPARVALECMSLFGKLALVATPHVVQGDVPEKPLRSHSLLHIAVSRGDVSAASRLLAAGVPVDLLAGDGLAPLHWATSVDGTTMMEYLLNRGSPVDVRSDTGTTPLMVAAEGGNVDDVRHLLRRGADVNAVDGRGFTALHRAAELGDVPIVGVLVEHGADAHVDADGHTPISLADGHDDIVQLLRRS